MDKALSKVIGERINILLTVQKKKQKELAEELGVTDNTISYFCSGSRIPNTGQIKKIAEYFHCSTDYLFGLSDSVATDKDMQFVCDVTGLSENAISFLRHSSTTYKNQPKDITSFLGQLLASGISQIIDSGMIAQLVEDMAKAVGGKEKQ